MRAIRWVALLIVVFGAAYLWQSFQIRQPTTYSAVGPRFFPIAIGIGIVLSGVWLFLLPGRPPEPDSPESTRLDWPRIAGMLVAVIVYILAFQTVGYIITTAVMLAAGAQILGERHHWVRDLVIGVLLAVALNFTFARLLGINLPAGLIGF
jgi:putative tricarboxylic transport membrane protein